jgi:hypothetical protein
MVKNEKENDRENERTEGSHSQHHLESSRGFLPLHHEAKRDAKVSHGVVQLAVRTHHLHSLPGARQFGEFTPSTQHAYSSTATSTTRVHQQSAQHTAAQHRITPSCVAVNVVAVLVFDVSLLTGDIQGPGSGGCCLLRNTHQTHAPWKPVAKRARA